MNEHQLREGRKPDYSIVVPVYFNEGSLEYTADRIFTEVFAKDIGRRGEIVFVDDGSRDGSFAELKRILAAHPSQVRVIKLSRNFGQVHAWWCGLCRTPGPVVIVSADGQDPIEMIPQMLDRHFNAKVEIVIATRESREDGLFRRLTSSLVYRTIRKLANPDIPDGGFDFFLIGKQAKETLLRIWQPNTFFQVRMLELGFSREMMPYHRANRIAGTSRWTLAKRLTYMIDGVLGHSYVPIRAMSLLGVTFSGMSFLLGVFFFAMYFVNPHVIPGWTPIILLILFIGGIQMMMIGVLGEYLWRVLAQTRGNPPYVIEQELDGGFAERQG